MRKLTLPLLLAVTLLPLTVGLAQDNEPSDDEVNSVAKGLYCPVCENVPLDVCPTQACKQWRETIREKLALGWSEEQIEQFFVDQYGDRVLASPPATGLNLAVYLIPPLVFVGGAMVLASAIRSWRKPPGQQVKPHPESTDDPYLQRLEDELRLRRGE